MMKIYGSILIEVSSGSLIKFAEVDLLENNVLIIKFDKYGIVNQKEFYVKKI